MKILLTCCALLMFGVAAAPADEMSIARQITDLNATLQKATRNHDAATIASMIAADYTLVSDTGAVWDRATFLKVVADPSIEWLANDPSDVTVRSYNGDCATITALLHTEYRMNGKVHNYIDRFTDVWVKDGDAWHYVTGHATLYKMLPPSGT